MELLHIRSAANPRFKHAKSLLKRRGRWQHAQLLLEGVRLIEDSISAGYPPALFFVDPRLRDELQPLVEKVQQLGGLAMSLEPVLLAELCDTVTPQGVVAVCPWPQLTPGTRQFSVVVDGVRDPGNLGSLVRAAAAAGVDQVVLLPGVTDPWAPKVLRAGMGGHYRVAIRWAAQVQKVHEWLQGQRTYLAAISATQPYTAVDWTLPSALIVGGEAAGAQHMAAWPGIEPIRIPMANDIESLNVAVATGVILFEAVRQRQVSLGQASQG